MAAEEPTDTDRDALGERLSHDQLRFLARVRRRNPGATLRWHRRGDGMLLEVRERGRGGREHSVLLAQLASDGSVRLDVPVAELRTRRRPRR